jgi:uncharacterized protein YcbK (DUF882 family)
LVESKQDPVLKEEGGYYIWEKGYEYPLTAHFSTREFTCKCSYESCKEQRISKGLVDKLELIRVEVGQPLIVTSGFRCTAHQEYIRKSGQSTVVAKKSTHELGDAVDIVPRDKKDVRGYFLKICANHFDSIGLSDKFLHVDQRVGVRRWEY